MLAIITSCSVLGIHGWLIQVEVDVATGLPTFSTVGLPDSSVRESKDRVKAAIKNCGYQLFLFEMSEMCGGLPEWKFDV